MKTTATLVAAGLTALSLLAGCGDDKPTHPLAAFQPEIVNTADNFQFQATDVQNVTTTLSYDWSNGGTQASVDHSSAVTDGSVEVMIYDHADSLVYSSPLMASANEPSAAGVPGTWRVVVALTGCSGTLNFRAQKL